MAKKRKITKTPATSEGARYERKAFRAMLRRRLGAATVKGTVELQEALDWVLKRQARYDQRKGGL